MPRKKNKKSRKPRRYKTVTFKLTVQQKKSLVNFSKSRRSTPIKIIKKAIRPLLQNYAQLEVNNTHEKVNQLELFKLD